MQLLNGHLQYMFITKYGGTLYIGMDNVFVHYACTFENSESNVLYIPLTTTATPIIH